jgi:hypothetical protein
MTSVGMVALSYEQWMESQGWVKETAVDGHISWGKTYEYVVENDY